MRPEPARLALGTVQLGLPYGVANRTGQPSLEDAAAILDMARAGGIDTLDTAQAYGTAETVLGEIGTEGFRLISKIGPMPAGTRDVAGWCRAAVEASLARLRRDRLDAVLLHRPEELLGPQGPALAAALDGLRAAGLASTTGLSIYSPDHLEALTACHAPGLIQAPANVFDRRLAVSGWAARLAERGCEIHGRSAFLQGLLLLRPEARPAHARRWPELWGAWDAWLAETGLSPTEACLRDALTQPHMSRVVVGVETAAQLRDLLDIVAQLRAQLTVAAAPLPRPPALPQAPTDLIDPARWPKT